MKILEFQYSDKEIDWHVAPIKFRNLTLLVGASGVGKTRILKAIQRVKDIAHGKSLNGVSWKISFSIDSDIYIWEGEFELIEKAVFVTISGNGDDENEANDNNKPSVLFEKITVNNDIITEREKSALVFKGEKSPIPIKAEQSVLSLTPDPIIKKAEQGFKKIFYSDYTNSAEGYTGKIVDDNILTKYKNLQDIRNSTEDLTTRLFWVYKKDKEVFMDIKDDFTAVFPQVTDLIFEPLELLKDASVPLFLKIAPFIQFKEDKSKDWIPVTGMSAGMYRTLIHIIELHLSSDGTVILIDEFENSLGVNCIDELTTEIKGAVHRIQFIITSHHPYIINNISFNNWKIVTRDGSKVLTHDAKDFNFGKSKHEAFIQLLNLPSYKTGKEQ